MKSLASTLSLVLLAGCSAEGLSFDAWSSLPGQTDGIALEGERARIGMADQVCDVEVRTATIATDFQAAEGQEHVFDSVGEQVVGAVGGRLFHRTAEGVTLFDGAPIDAAVGPSGEPVALIDGTEGCQVVFGTEGFVIDGLACAGRMGFAYDAGSDAAWVADGRLLVRVDASGGASAWEVDVDQVVWAASHAVVARTGDRTVTAIDAEGLTLWSAELDGDIVQVAGGPEGGDVAVMIDDGPAGGTLVVFDGQGVQQADLPLPAIAGVTFGSEVLALDTPDAVLFYGVHGRRSPFDTSALSAPEVGSAVGVESAVGVAGVFLATALIVD